MSDSSDQFCQDIKFAMFLSFGLQKKLQWEGWQNRKTPNLVLRPCAVRGLFISKLSRAYVQQEVRKAPQKHLLKAIVKKIIMQSRLY